MNNNIIENDYVMEDVAAIVSETDAAPYDHYDSSSANDSSTCCSTGTMNNDLGDDDDDNDNNNNNGNNNENRMMVDDSNEGNSSNSNRKNNENKYGISKIDPLYNPNGDDEDEAYVYKHLRGGIEENVTIRSNKNQGQGQDPQNQHHPQNHNQHQQRTQELEQAKMLKPRNSDGILSCPCCFQIVCMDCQKHEKYTNQYRAMFVMNIGVDWNVLVTPEHIGGNSNSNNNKNGGNDDQAVEVDRKRQKKNQIPTDEEHNAIQQEAAAANNAKQKEEENDMYYSVYCNSCKTQVAALDMKDEVYHFFGCIVSG